MSLELWIAFVAASVVMLVIPGPTILTVVSYGMAHGRRVSLPLVAAVALGDSTALSLSLLGLGALLATSAQWFTVIKVVGGLYLVYLGIRLFRSGAPLKSETPESADSVGRLFINTYIVTALNPKGIVFFLAFLPQFVDPSRPTAPQLWLLAVTFVVLATTSALMYALFAGSAQRFMGQGGGARIFNRCGGGLLCCAGVWALLARRPV